MTKTILSAVIAGLTTAEKERPTSQVAKLIDEVRIDKSVYDSCADTNIDYFGDGEAIGDSYGDGCEDYANYPNWCGNYDTSEFDSMEMCCACGGGFSSPIDDTTHQEEIDLDDIEFTLTDLESLIIALDVVKGLFVTGEPKPVNKMNHLVHFIDWVENFTIPNDNGNCEVRGTR